MSIGFGQIIIVLIVLVILFGNFSKITNNLLSFIKELKKVFSQEDSTSAKENVNKIEDKSSKE